MVICEGVCWDLIEVIDGVWDLTICPYARLNSFFSRFFLPLVLCPPPAYSIPR